MVLHIISYCFRVGELAFAATVAGLVGQFIHNAHKDHSSATKRSIYTMVVAALSMLIALVFFIPSTGGFIHYPIDFVLSILWIVAFALLVNYIGPLDCGSIWSWGDITQKGACQRWKAAIAFSFLSAIFWFASGLLAVYIIHRARRTTRTAVVDGTAGRHRRRWYRSRV